MQTEMTLSTMKEKLKITEIFRKRYISTNTSLLEEESFSVIDSGDSC